MPEENKYKALDSLTPTNKQTQAHDSVHILVEIIIIFLKFRGTLTIETTQRLENFKHFEACHGDEKAGKLRESGQDGIL